MPDIPLDLLYQSISIDITFGSARPMFGDLFLICGYEHPRFPATGVLPLASLADLQFEQVDDYFGIRALDDEGTDVPIWLYPLIAGETAYHDPGPFDAVRLDYCILRNPVDRADHYLKCVESFSQFAANTTYRNRQNDLGVPPDLSQVRTDIDVVVKYWATKGIVVGTSEALGISF